MSCKVITHAGASPVSRLAFPPFGVEGDAFQHPSATAPEASAVEAGGNEDVAKLHARIVELERSLQDDVRHGREAAFRDGEKAGRDRANAELQPILERLARAVSDVATYRARVRKEAESDLVQLALAIARRVLRREVTIDPDSLLGLVKAALEKAQAREICRIRIHPAHVAFLRKHLEMTGSGAGTEVIADQGLQMGDLLIETSRGDLDASLETQLREIERGFADRLREGR